MRNTLIFKVLQKRFLPIFQLADYQAITSTPLNAIINSLNHKYLNSQKPNLRSTMHISEKKELTL